jgi:hypothetical protein
MAFSRSPRLPSGCPTTKCPGGARAVIQPVSVGSATAQITDPGQAAASSIAASRKSDATSTVAFVPRVCASRCLPIPARGRRRKTTRLACLAALVTVPARRNGLRGRPPAPVKQRNWPKTRQTVPRIATPTQYPEAKKCLFNQYPDSFFLDIRSDYTAAHIRGSGASRCLYILASASAIGAVKKLPACEPEVTTHGPLDSQYKRATCHASHGGPPSPVMPGDPSCSPAIVPVSG